MAKRERKNKSSIEYAKRFGRSYGDLIKDPVLGDTVTQKIFNARKENNPYRYKNV